MLRMGKTRRQAKTVGKRGCQEMVLYSNLCSRLSPAGSIGSHQKLHFWVKKIPSWRTPHFETSFLMHSSHLDRRSRVTSASMSSSSFCACEPHQFATASGAPVKHLERPNETTKSREGASFGREKPGYRPCALMTLASLPLALHQVQHQKLRLGELDL